MNMIFFSFLNFYDSIFNKLIPLFGLWEFLSYFNSFSSDKKFFYLLLDIFKDLYPDTKPIKPK